MAKASVTKAPATKAPEARPRWKTALEVGVIVLVFLVVRAWQTSGTASGDAPAIDALDLRGAPIAIGGEREGPLVVHFFASWCGICQATEGGVVSFAQDHEVVAVASQSGGAEAVRRYASEHHLEGMRVVPDPEGSVAARYGVRAFPTTFWLDRHGAIRHVEVGFTTELGMRLRAFLAGI